MVRKKNSRFIMVGLVAISIGVWSYIIYQIKQGMISSSGNRYEHPAYSLKRIVKKKDTDLFRLDRKSLDSLRNPFYRAQVKVNTRAGFSGENKKENEHDSHPPLIYLGYISDKSGKMAICGTAAAGTVLLREGEFWDGFRIDRISRESLQAQKKGKFYRIPLSE